METLIFSLCYNTNKNMKRVHSKVVENYDIFPYCQTGHIAKNCWFILEIWPFNHLSRFLGIQHMNSIVVLYSSWTPGLQWILSNHWETKTAIKFAAISWPPLAPADRPSRNPWERSQYHKRILILFCLKSTFTYFYKNYLLKPWQKRRTKRLLECFKNTLFVKRLPPSMP